MKTIYCKSKKDLFELCDNNLSNHRVTTIKENNVKYRILHARGKNGEHLIYKYRPAYKAGWVKTILNEPTRTASSGVVHRYCEILKDFLNAVSSSQSSHYSSLLIKTQHHPNSYNEKHLKKIKGFERDTNLVINEATQDTIKEFCQKHGIDEELLIDEILTIPELSSDPKNAYLKNALESFLNKVINEEENEIE